jgi:hypothetical protein
MNRWKNRVRPEVAAAEVALKVVLEAGVSRLLENREVSLGAAVRVKVAGHAAEVALLSRKVVHEAGVVPLGQKAVVGVVLQSRVAEAVRLDQKVGHEAGVRQDLAAEVDLLDQEVARPGQKVAHAVEADLRGQKVAHAAEAVLQGQKVVHVAEVVQPGQEAVHAAEVLQDQKAAHEAGVRQGHAAVVDLLGQEVVVGVVL